MKFYKKDSSNMSEIVSNSVQLIVTSPPYPMIAKWDELFGCVDFEFQHRQLNQVWIECKRVLIEGGIACINIGDATRTIKGRGFTCYPNYAKVVINMMNLGFIPLIPILWRKISNKPNSFLGSGFLPPNGYVTQEHEFIGIFRKGRLRKFPPKDRNRYASSFTHAERDNWFAQTWEIPGEKNAKKNSSFPREIPSRLIKMFSVLGDVVLDPFCGIKTTMKVAEELGRIGIGYDIKRKGSEKER